MRYFGILFLLALSCLAAAQENEEATVLTNKKGSPVLPRTGDWAIGISAAPFLDYAGNLLSSGSVSAPYFTSSNPGSLFIKYHNTESASLRAGLSIGITHSVDKVGSPAADDKYDKSIISALSGELSIGIEKYIGSGNRLRGYYGFDAGISKDAYYGYRYLSYTITQGTYHFVNADTAQTDFIEKGGNTLTLSGTGFIGFEYFFLPKICISGEFGLRLSGSMTTDRKYVPENAAEVIFNPGGFAFNTSDITSGSIAVFLYF